MKVIPLVFLFVTAFASSLFAQDEITKKTMKEMVGFACFYEGSASKPVENAEKKLKKKQYGAIAQLLESENTADRYLAVIVLEYLHANRNIAITEPQQILIDEIKTDEKSTLYICSGCTMLVQVTLKQLFSNEFREFPVHWLDNNVQL